ncbi:uncharacterized protein METZ01_LOCUS417926 [marine metagenome]|jgi:hypothetical protein|uniref:Uncharacterized protein n=1 Tax=marine metagenome TaxID=408172 RepID=A0A382X1V6_9ZZZZ
MLQFFKDNLDRQLQFLGLVVGFWALMLLNDQILYLMSDYYESDTPLLELILITIFQMWVVIKYIMKK